MIDQIASERIELCRKNTCGLYDKDGISPEVIIRGKESCGGCGCMLKEKTSCLSCSCYLEEIGKEPMWRAVTND